MKMDLARRCRASLSRFRTSIDGNIAMIFALSSLPLLAFTGVAVDYGLATRLQTKLQAAADATALGLCQTPLATTTATLQTQAGIVSLDYMGATSGVMVDTLAVTSNPRKITLTTHIRSKTFFPKFTGVSVPLVSASSQCATPLPKTFEIALVLDNTGSMAESSGSQSKIQAVQQAASSFVDYVKSNGAFSTSSRIAIVPFAAAVAIDPSVSGTATASWVDTMGLSTYHWSNIDATIARRLGFTSRLSIFQALKNSNSSWAWAGCFETPPYPQNVQDGAPSTSNTQAGWNTLYVPLFAPDEPGAGNATYSCWSTNGSTNCNSNSIAAYTFNSYIDDTGASSLCSNAPTDFLMAERQPCKYATRTNAQPTSYGTYTGLPNGPNYQCVSKPLQRLTSDSTVLKNLISSMTAAGSTNIHDGMMWGWRTLSPISVFADGAPYSAANSTSPTATNKVMILMTDGTNTWPTTNYNSYNGYSQYFTLGYIQNADGTTPSTRLPSGYQTVTSATQQRNALDELTLEACTNAKAAGISIYTIGFSIPSDPIDSQGVTMLKNCATSSSQAFIANDSNSLIAAFGQIAASIGSLRISQ